MGERQKIIVIGGPTASGKSAVAVDLALQFGGEIVNADSMQVYRRMDVGTAKPPVADRNKVPHHLLDVVNPDQDFNASVYRSMALPVLQDLKARGRVGFVVGGTGLYIKALLGGLLRCPPVDQDFRKSLQRDLEVLGTIPLHARLRRLDPAAAERIHPNDRVRIMRALEIVHLTKDRASSLMREHEFGDRPFQALKICLQMERKQLYHQINERCLRMIEQGLIRETQELLDKGYSPALKPMKALGYRHMIAVLQGVWDLNTAISKLQRDTRQYAKRQLTWFRADPQVTWFFSWEGDAMRNLVAAFLSER